MQLTINPSSTFYARSSRRTQICCKAALRPTFTREAFARVSRAADSPNSRARGPRAPAPADLTDANAAETTLALQRTLPIGNRRTNSRPARSSRLSDGRYSDCVWSHVGSGMYRSSQCVRIGRSDEGAATNPLRRGIRHNPSRWVWLPGECRQVCYPCFLAAS